MWCLQFNSGQFNIQYRTLLCCCTKCLSPTNVTWFLLVNQKLQWPAVLRKWHGLFLNKTVLKKNNVVLIMMRSRTACRGCEECLFRSNQCQKCFVGCKPSPKFPSLMGVGRSRPKCSFFGWTYHLTAVVHCCFNADERKALILVIKSAQTYSTAPACCSFTTQPFNQAKASSEDWAVLPHKPPETDRLAVNAWISVWVMS